MKSASSIHWESKGRIFRQFLLEVVLVSLLAVIPAFLIGRMVSHRFLEQFVGQTGQQQTLDLLNQVPQGLSLGIAYASLFLCLDPFVARCNYQHDLARVQKKY